MSGERAHQRLLIRLALGPEGQVAPDIHGKAPGRGAWIGVPAIELETARTKGKLAGLLKRAFKMSDIAVPDDLVGRIEAGLEKATLDRLGLEARAGNLLSGAEKIDAAARGGGVAMMLHAKDASEDGAAKRDQSWRVGLEEEGSGRRGVRLPVDRDRLSAALGRSNSVHVAITDHKAAGRVKHHLERWLYFIGCSNARGDTGTSSRPDRAADTASNGS